MEGCSQRGTERCSVVWEVASGALLWTQAGTSLPVCAETAPGAPNAVGEFPKRGRKGTEIGENEWGWKVVVEGEGPGSRSPSWACPPSSCSLGWGPLQPARDGDFHRIGWCQDL